MPEKGVYMPHFLNPMSGHVMNLTKKQRGAYMNHDRSSTALLFTSFFAESHLCFKVREER